MADARLTAYLDAAAGDALVTADPGLVRMLTGHTAEIAFGPSPFQLPALAVAPADGQARLVCSADEAPEHDAVHVYEGFTVGPLDPVGGAAGALRTALAAAGSPSRIVVDGATVPSALLAGLPGAVPAGPRLALLRAVKTGAEVEGIEAALRACEAGQAAARSAARDGLSELDLWSAVQGAIEQVVAARTPLMADLVSGPRTAEVGGPPGDRRLAVGDLVLCDLVPRVDGLWGDSCSTWSLGDPPAPARDLHAAARDALEVGLATLRPGARAGDVDAAVRGAMRARGYDYPHHTGHGIGFGWHEEPRIVPGSHTVLEPGMVVALEPGTYGDGLGVRVEQVAVVTPEGCRVLSRHSLDLTRESEG
jgi:Xaa-Pro aminopeptidase